MMLSQIFFSLVAATLFACFDVAEAQLRGATAANSNADLVPWVEIVPRDGGMGMGMMTKKPSGSCSTELAETEVILDYVREGSSLFAGRQVDMSLDGKTIAFAHQVADRSEPAEIRVLRETKDGFIQVGQGLVYGESFFNGVSEGGAVKIFQSTVVRPHILFFCSHFSLLVFFTGPEW